MNYVSKYSSWQKSSGVFKYSMFTQGISGVIVLSQGSVSLSPLAQKSFTFVNHAKLISHRRRNAILWNPVKGHFPFYFLLITCAWFQQNKHNGTFRNAALPAEESMWFTLSMSGVLMNISASDLISPGCVQESRCNVLISISYGSK